MRYGLSVRNDCKTCKGNIHRKAPVMKSLYNKVATLLQAYNFIQKRFQHSVYLKKKPLFVDS